MYMGIWLSGAKNINFLTTSTAAKAPIKAPKPWRPSTVAFLGGMLFATIHSVLCVKFKANQVISGVVINILATALTGFLTSQLNESIFGAASSQFKLIPSARFSVPLLSREDHKEILKGYGHVIDKGQIVSGRPGKAKDKAGAQGAMATLLCLSFSGASPSMWMAPR